MSESKWRRIVANQQIAAQSTGPKTEAGKQASSRNATKHGLTSRRIVIAGEDAEEFNQMRETLFDAWHPVNVVERELVEDVVQHRWRMLRAQNAEALFFDELVAEELEADPALTPDRAFARLFSNDKHAKRMNLMMRYLREATRAYDKAVTQLKKVLAHRVFAELSRQQMAEPVDRANPLADPAPPHNGFVSVRQESLADLATCKEAAM